MSVTIAESNPGTADLPCKAEVEQMKEDGALKLIVVISTHESAGRWASAYGSVLLPDEQLSVLSADQTDRFPVAADLLHIDYLDRNLEGRLSEIDPQTLVVVSPLLTSPRDAVKPEMFTGRGPAGSPALTFSMVPLWQSPWFIYVRRLLSSGRIGAISEITATAQTTFKTGGPEFKPADLDSPIMRALIVPCGLSLKPVKWIEIAADAGEPPVAVGEIGGVPVRITMDSTSSGVSFVIQGTTGQIVITSDDARASVVVRDEPGESKDFEHFDIFSLTARYAVESMRRHSPTMPPVSAAFAVRESAFELEQMLKPADSPDAREGERPAFVANSFVSGRKGDTSGLQEAKVFVETRCNLACPFCFSRNPEEAASTPADYGKIFASDVSNGFNAVILSGGEPTLNTDLAEIIRIAVRSGMRSVSIETNAIRLAEPGMAESLVSAGLTGALVSLHSLDPDTLYAMTGVRGTLERSLKGIENLQNTGIPINVNCVTTIHNFRELPDIARYVAARPKSVRQVGWSFMAGAGDAINHPELLPPLTEAMPYLIQALEIIDAAGLDTIIPGQCGIPQCMLPDHQSYFINNKVAVSDPSWKACQMENKVFTESCPACAAYLVCYGIWQTYASVYGTDEFVPLKNR
jgi:uncharacterized radical SAM superfamily Fe-S cluster-containing enzyme